MAVLVTVALGELVGAGVMVLLWVSVVERLGDAEWDTEMLPDWLLDEEGLTEAD